MLTPETTAVIKQTLPVLQAHGETLTRHFYQRMFSHNPEVQPFFNPAHQHSGSQQRALAGAICAYAQHIENPAELAGAVELIAQKHVSLGIRPEQYPIVGENLLASIQEVLGDAATPAIIDAWAQAYGVLADIFIQREGEIFEEQEKTYGWQGFKDFMVDRREASSGNILSFYLKPSDGLPLTAHKPGQYITVRVTLPDGTVAMRNYSLSNAPGAPYYRISVKRETALAANTPDGVISNYLHDHLQAGDSLELGPPCGEFTLQMPEDPRKPLVFIAGGVGVTPLMSMLHAALKQSSAERPVVFIQGALNGTVHAFADEVASLQTRHPNLRTHVRYSDATEADRNSPRHDSEGLIDAALLEELLGDAEAAYYFCGPKAMLQHLYPLLKQRGVADEDLHFEFFGPAETLEACPVASH